MATNDEVIDLWATDDFEDTVARALIACFETKIRKGLPREEALTRSHMQRIRVRGVYVPGPDLAIVPRTRREWLWKAISEFCDAVENDGERSARRERMVLPKWGILALPYDGELGYFSVAMIERRNALPKGYFNVAGGMIYEHTSVIAVKKGGLMGFRQFITVHPDRNITVCTDDLHAPRTASDLHIEESAYMTLTHAITRPRKWTISAQEENALAHLGCGREEVKSLLYARSLPLSATGRKRPILHLVECHKRRIQSGIDVDVTAFLRGQQTVEIGGTVFTVNPAPVLRDELSENSQRYFERSA